MNMQIFTNEHAVLADSSIHQFLFHCRYEKNLNDKTLNAYATDLRQFIGYIQNMNPCEDIKQVTRDMLKNYFQEISHFKPKTVKRKIASLKAIMNFLEFEDETYVSPFRKLKVKFKEPYVLPAVMTMDEVRKIFQSVYTEHRNNTCTDNYTYKAQVRNIAVMELLFATGVRVSELCNLKCSDIDLQNGLVKVFGKGSKERIIQICQREVLTALKNYFRLFKPVTSFFVNRLGLPLAPQSVRLLIKKYARAARIDKRITPHTFRHTFATLLLEEGVDIKYIQNLLGHSTIATTQIYTHVNAEKQKKILSTKHPRRKMNFDEDKRIVAV